jgi:ribosome-associated translation inhibitor RaiA
MFSVNLSKLKVNEAELKAYIYQQLEAIQPYAGDAALSIKMSYDEKKHFQVKILASHEIGDIEAEGHDEDVYSALANAKDALIKSLSSLDFIEEEEFPTERNQEIADILAGKNYLH